MYDSDIMPEYVSTRSKGDTESKSYSDVLLEGLARDGGLYVPTEYPHLTPTQIENFAGLSYSDLFVEVKSLLVGDSMDIQTQMQLADAAYSEEKFPDTQNGNITPIIQIDDNLYIQDLSEGPTAAFKDLALQAVGQDMNHELNHRGGSLNILGGTSGDTGSAAEAAVKGLGNVTLFMLSPLDGMSDFQRAQMAALSGGNIHNIAVDEPFDHLQAKIKELNNDPEFADLGAVNSINYGRVASQVPYYFSAYLQVKEGKVGEPVDFVVPSGNMGNALAAYIAQKMGLPIRNIIIATNENSGLDHLIQTGQYKKKPSSITSSPSMDIAVASNYERVIHDILGGNADLTRQYYEQFERTGLVDFRDIDRPSNLLKAAGFDSGNSNHDKRVQTTRRVYKEAGVIIDPHTADGVAVAYEKSQFEVPTICMETALPVKFEPFMQEALGFIPERPERFKGLESVSGNEGFVVIPGGSLGTAALKDYIRNNAQPRV
ncbi:MAG: threonine synthase [Candidatus Saccharibacteria bacterium]|nr:threonine synthase [Candidatus Saccharibacteria bacterium]